MLWSKIPWCILETKRITRLEKEVFATVMSLNKMGIDTSINEIARHAVYGDRKNTKKAIKKLCNEGLLTKIESEESKFNDYVVSELPDWLIKENNLYLTSNKYTLSKKLKDSVMKNDGGGSLTKNTDKVNDDENKKGGVSDLERGGSGTEKRGSETPHSIENKDHKKNIADDRQQIENQEQNFSDEDDELELNYDGDSMESRQKLYGEKSEKQSRRKAKVKRRAPSDKTFQFTPSLRWEFQAQDNGKPVTNWTAIDLLGYWVTKYKKMLKKEPDEFEFTDVKSKKFQKYLGIARQYSKNHYDGKFTGIKEKVDAVFDNAIASGEDFVVDFVYYFTPSNRSTLDNIHKRMYGKSKEKISSSLSDFNDNIKWNDEDEEKRAIEDMKNRKRKRELLNK
jgi:hypothetical protein